MTTILIGLISLILNCELRYCERFFLNYCELEAIFYIISELIVYETCSMLSTSVLVKIPSVSIDAR